MVLEALRDAGGKRLSTDEVASLVIAAKGFDAAATALRAAIRDQAWTPLRAFRKRGTVEQSGLGREVRWKLRWLEK